MREDAQDEYARKKVRLIEKIRADFTRELSVLRKRQHEEIESLLRKREQEKMDAIRRGLEGS